MSYSPVFWALTVLLVLASVISLTIWILSSRSARATGIEKHNAAPGSSRTRRTMHSHHSAPAKTSPPHVPTN